ncbi:O-methylsterigmatocystin oxidoreductase [Grifola frondosa]|uniref:O-methylsterigmatocystin oxidoreductase n=1 Tax=Grifola frondosa TaxID=5627 RepID=A0A1C7ML54_GRIFR|nr:O-methylsterigmatocystin oxidoreductase [Grifola frondosa]
MQLLRDDDDGFFPAHSNEEHFHHRYRDNNFVDVPHFYSPTAKEEPPPSRSGDMISVTLFGQPVVILNSLQLAFDTLDKKSLIYSSRPSLVMGGQIVGWDQTVALRPYGKQLREHRRLLSQFIGSHKNVEQFVPLIEVQTSLSLFDILHKPDDVAEHVRRTAGAIILMMSHGYQVQNIHDPILELVERATTQVSQVVSPGAFLVDTFPLLRYVPAWMPGAGWKKKAAFWKQTLQDMINVPHNYVMGQMAAGTAIPNFTSINLEKDSSPESEVLIKSTAASLYSGGADTTVSAVMSLFLAMTCFPDIQKKAQHEIDTVVGSDRLPVFADRERLPYINAICLEVLRWNPIATLGIPHCLSEDDVHDGYFLPKGTIVFANIWHFAHDPATYTNPMEFNPERFVPSSDKPAEQDPRTMVFGFGRRICPGLNFADASIFVSCAMILAVFQISKVVENGVVVEPTVKYTSSPISHPFPFKCFIQARSSKAAAPILSAHNRK